TASPSCDQRGRSPTRTPSATKEPRGGSSTVDASATKVDARTLAAIRLSEFLPAPRERFAQEWVELQNTSDNTIELGGWQLDDAEGGSSPIVLTADQRVAANNFLLIELSKALLNNDGDTLRLLAPDGTVVDEVVIDASRPDHSFSLIEGVWDDNAEPSPGNPNNMPPANLEAEEAASPAEKSENLPSSMAPVEQSGVVTANVSEVGAPSVFLPTNIMLPPTSAEALYEAQVGQAYLFAPSITALPVVAAELSVAVDQQPVTAGEDAWPTTLGGGLLLIAAILFWVGRRASGEDEADDASA
ncbi:lamin tail domain-containing protein, partial [Candidatus Gracilibacteria bacterium]|nr:lamin tail domain-containing protein [Candidatus Gracilibacteria bacterium]